MIINISRMVRTFSVMKNTQRLKSTYSCKNFFFKKYLFLTNSISSGICMGLGDVIQQEIELQSTNKNIEYNWYRSGRMFITGLCIGPWHHYYYVYLDKILPKSDLKTVGFKILSDQLLAAPLTIVSFFYTMGILEKRNVPDITEELIQKFKYVYLADLLFWPPVQFINFYFLPSQYRVFYINVATTIFNVFLSFMKHFDRE